ncbi:MAG: polymer-forming cytoskeletal protein [Desulfobacteraceae bacterium]|nr:polymer-forming cytoskeletal protein [Desulfobacteraceae bacterium]
MKKKNKRQSAGNSTISTLLGRETSFEGTLSFNDTIRIDGRVIGNLVSKDGTIIVGENAVIEADIQVAVIVVRGKVTGRVEASQRIELFPPAVVAGDLHAPAVAIDSGVVFNGNCYMQDQPAVSPKKKTEKETESPGPGKPADHKK